MHKVLVIDDSPEVREVISGTLTMYGYQTLTAEDGYLGVQIALQHRPDLILCDVKMPNLDGYATLRALRQHADTSTIPFILLSGYNERSDLRPGIDLKADGYLTKPFALAELLATVKAWLEKPAPTARPDA